MIRIRIPLEGMPMKRILLLPIVLLLSACNVIPSLAGVKPTPTDCGCSVKGPSVATPTGGLALSGPAAPGENTTATPAGLDAFRDQWKSYSNPTYGFSFDYPAVYESPNFGFCKVRDQKALPQGALYALDLGSRIQITLVKTDQALPAVVDAFRQDPLHQDFQFDAPKDRTVGGAPAVVLPYRSGGTNRYAETALFVKDNILYRIDVGTPSACDVPEINLKELDAYSRVLDSFKFK